MFELLAELDGGTFQNPAGQAFQPGDPTQTATSITKIISNSVGLLTSIAGIMFLLYFFIGALSWALAGGDEGKVENAKKQMTNGAIGLVIVVLAYGIVAVLGDFVGIPILDPASVLQSIGPGVNRSGGGGGGGTLN